MRLSPSAFANRVSPRLLGAIFLALMLGAPHVQAASFEVDYNLSLLGLPLGQADLKVKTLGESYNMAMSAQLSGLAGMVTGGKGSATSAGQMVNGRVASGSFAVSSRSSSDKRVVRMGLKNGDVQAIDIDPPLEAKADRVPVLETHKRNILDPLSALLMPTKGTALDPSNCNRTLPVFDGAARFDIQLSYAGTQNVKKKGYEGQALVCNARYLPIAGHRAKRPAVQFMQNNKELSVWLAPLGTLTDGTTLLAPLRVSVKTMIGTSVLEASRITLEQDSTSATAKNR